MSAAQASLLAQAFADNDIPFVRRVFVSGYSGATVLLVSAGPDQPPTVIKLAPPQELHREYQAYQQYVRNISPQDIAHVQGEPLIAEDGLLGLIQYTYVGGQANEPAISLHDYYDSHGAAATSEVLNRIFRVFGRHWWASHRPHVYVLGEQYDRLLTSHLEIVPVAYLPSDPLVFEAGSASTTSVRGLVSGQPVRFLGFEVEKIGSNGADLTLTAAPPPNEATPPLRIKVRGTEPAAYRPGDRAAQVDGIVIATRQTVLTGAAHTALPGYEPGEQKLTGSFAEGALQQHGIQLLNPLYELDSLLDRVMDVRFSVIHGDLNLQNVLVDADTGFAWLIDFAETRLGPTVFDLQRLEVQVISKLLPPALLASSLGPECIIDLMVALHRDPPEARAPHQGLADPYTVLSTIRLLARQYLVDDRDWDEYYQGLVIALVGALKYAELDETARTLMLLAAATARGLIGQPLRKRSDGESGPSRENRAGEPSAASAAPEPPAPPPEPEDFVGRSDEIGRYAEQIRSSGLAIIAGMTGVGKTALAAALVRQVAAEQNTFWYSFGAAGGLDDLIWKLAGFLYWNEQPELWHMLREVQITGGQPPPASVLFDYVMQMLPGRDYLLCLDNFHVVDQDPLLKQVGERLRALTKARQLSLLIVSQTVPGFLAQIAPEPLTGLSYDDTNRLVAARNISIDETVLRALYSYTEGNVLFLDIALNTLAGESDPESVLEQLQDSAAIETAMFEKLDAKLTDQERDIECAIAVLGSPCTRHQIEATLDAGNLRRALHDMSQRNLVTSQRRGSEHEYVQHGILKHFYYGQPSRERLRQMHRRAAQLFEEDELDVLRAAEHYAKAQEYSKSVTLATDNVRLLISLYQARRLAELLSSFEQKRLSELEWAKVNAALGRVYAFLAESSQAKTCYETANSLLEWMDDGPEVTELRAIVFRGMGQLIYNEKPQDALDWFQRAFDEYSRASSTMDQRTEAALYIDMGWAYRRLHKVPEALDVLQRGLERLPRGPGRLRGDALTRLAGLYVSQFDLENARRYAQLAVENSRHLRDIWQEQTVLAMSGNIKHLGCDWNGAIKDYDAALKLASEIGDSAAHAAMEVNLGVAYANLGDAALALEHLHKGVDLSQQCELNNHELKAQIAVARLHMRLGDWDDAEKHLDAAEGLVERSESANARFHLPLILSARAELRLLTGNVDEASTLADQSIAMSIEQEKQVDLAICQRVKAQVLMASGDYREAAALLEQSLPLLQDRQRFEATKTKALLGLCLRSIGESVRGEELIAEAKTVFTSIGAAFDLADLEQHAAMPT
ncbi:MAG: phosphotransferase [Caldilineaceae bacterium]